VSAARSRRAQTKLPQDQFLPRTAHLLKDIPGILVHGPLDLGSPSILRGNFRALGPAGN